MNVLIRILPPPLPPPSPPPQARAMDALKRCDNDPHVVVAVSTIFMHERKYTKARKWFNRAVTLDADLGDAWTAYLKFELQHGEEEQRRAVVERCVAADPHHGEVWQSVSKVPENRALKPDEVLLKCAEKVDGFLKKMA